MIGGAGQGSSSAVGNDHQDQAIVTEIAPRVEDIKEDTPLEDTDPGFVDPVLKCIQGDYTGRYIYLSNCAIDETQTKGIVIGGGK